MICAIWTCPENHPRTKCNNAIRKNIEITVENPDNAKLAKMPRGSFRVVKTGNLDATTNVCFISNVFFQ